MDITSTALIKKLLGLPPLYVVDYHLYMVGKHTITLACELKILDMPLDHTVPMYVYTYIF